MMSVVNSTGVSEIFSNEDLSKIGEFTNEALNAEIVSRVERGNDTAITRILDGLGLEIAQKVLGKAEELSEDEHPAVLTVTCAGGHIIIPNTGTVLINPNRDPLQIHNFLNGKGWGEFITGERSADMLVPCAVRLSAVSSHDIHDIYKRYDSLSGRVSLEEEEEEEDPVGRLRVKKYKPDSKLDPLAVEGLTKKSVFGDEDGKGKTPGDEEIFKKAKALVMAELAAGAPDQSDTRQPIESFDHLDPKTGQTSRVHIEYRNNGKAVLVDERGKTITLSVSDVADLYPRFYLDEPESGETFSGVAALAADDSTEHRDITISVRAEVISTEILDTAAESLLRVGDPNRTLVETFLLNEKSHPINALNKFLLDELKEDSDIADKINFRPIVHVDPSGTDKHNFVCMETMLYEHSRRPDFEQYNVGDRLGRNLTPILLSPGVLVFRDEFMAGKIPEIGENYIVMVKKGGSWKVGRFANAQKVDDWMNELNELNG